MKIKLGKEYEDKITGFKGIATGICEYISGCNQVLLSPRVDSSGNKVEGHWIDEQRLISISNGILELDNSKTPGFDKPAPKN